MPAARAASSRLIPSEALASANRRLLTRPSRSRRASARSSAGVRPVAIGTATMASAPGLLSLPSQLAGRRRRARLPVASISSGQSFRTDSAMSRAFAYLRVSTAGQTTDNQLGEIAAAGFAIEPRRVVTETVSGSVATARRPGFARLLDRLEPGDVLVVTKLDRLGRNATDVGSTVARLAGIGVRVHWLALGGRDLASSTGKLTMGVINAVAEFERDLLVERTQAGLSRAKAEGKRLGRPASLTAERRRSVLRRLEEGATVSALAREFETSRQTILRVRDGTSAS